MAAACFALAVILPLGTETGVIASGREVDGAAGRSDVEGTAIATQSTAATSATAYRNAAAQLNDFVGGPTAAESRAIESMWHALGQFLLQRLSNGAVNPQTIGSALAGLDQNLRQSGTLVIQPGTVLVAVARNSIGHVLVLSARRNTQPTLWHIGSRAAVKSATEGQSCWTGAADRPCAATAVGRLPNGEGGVHRFYVDAEYFQPAGATRGHQLSFWRWNGKSASPDSVAGNRMAIFESVDHPGGPLEADAREFIQVVEQRRDTYRRALALASAIRVDDDEHRSGCADEGAHQRADRCVVEKRSERVR